MTMERCLISGSAGGEVISWQRAQSMEKTVRSEVIAHLIWLSPHAEGIQKISTLSKRTKPLRMQRNLPEMAEQWLFWRDGRTESVPRRFCPGLNSAALRLRSGGLLMRMKETEGPRSR